MRTPDHPHNTGGGFGHPAQAGASPAPRRSPALVLGLLVACLGAQNAVAATLLPAALAELGALGWFNASYAFFFGCNLVGVVVGGVASQRHRPRSVLLTGIAVLVVGAALVAAGGSVGAVLAGRAAQGLGGGIAIIVVYVAIGASVPAPDRPRALAAATTGWVVATIISPVLAGAVAEATSWRGAYAFLGVGVAATGAAVWRRLEPTPATSERATTRPVLQVLVPALAVLAIGLELGSGLLSVALLAVLGILTAATLRPLLPEGTYRLRPGVAAAIALRGVLMGAFIACELWLPYVLAEVRDIGPGASGAWLSTGAAGWAAASLLYARSVRGGTTGEQRVRAARTGSAVVVIGTLGQCLVLAPGVPAIAPLALWVAAAFGMGLALVPMGASLYEESPPDRYAMNAAALQLADVTIAAVIIGLGSTLASAVAPAHRLDVVAVSFLVAAACALLAAAAAPRIRSSP